MGAATKWPLGGLGHEAEIAAMKEHEIQAAAIKVGISNYVGTAALAVLAGAVALFTFFKQNYDPSIVFYVAFVVAVAALVASIFLGGRGANATAYYLADGTWTKDTRMADFDLQATLTLIGLILTVASAVLGTTSSPHRVIDPCVSVLSADLSRSNPDVGQMRQDLTTCQR